MKKQTSYPPSDEFQQAFTYAGSIRGDCDFCGRTHFCNREDAGDWSDGELEQLREAERRNPSQTMGWDCTSISHGTIDGREFIGFIEFVGFIGFVGFVEFIAP